MQQRLSRQKYKKLTQYGRRAVLCCRHAFKSAFYMCCNGTNGFRKDANISETGVERVNCVHGNNLFLQRLAAYVRALT